MYDASHKRRSIFNFGSTTTALPLGYIFLAGIIPISFVVVQSFTFSDIEGRSFGAVTLNGYALLLRSHRLAQLERLSIRALSVVAINILLGVPAAFILVRMLSARMRLGCLTLFTIPFLLSDVTRAFSWRILLGHHGAINRTLLYVGVIKSPMSQLLFSDFAVFIALVSGTLSFMIFASTLSIGAIPEELWDVSQEFGLGPVHQFLKVAIPLSLPGILAGGACVFFACIGASAEMTMLGGMDQSTIARLVADLESARNLTAAFGLGALIFGIVIILALAYRFSIMQRRAKL